MADGSMADGPYLSFPEGQPQKRVVIPLTSEIALSAAELSGAHKLATADAIIYATALMHDADVLTCDAHFKNLPRVTYIEKRA